MRVCSSCQSRTGDDKERSDRFAVEAVSGCGTLLGIKALQHESMPVAGRFVTTGLRTVSKAKSTVCAQRMLSLRLIGHLHYDTGDLYSVTTDATLLQGQVVDALDLVDATEARFSVFTGDFSRPVETVSWEDATNYCAQLTKRERAARLIPPNSVYRLPTEAERETPAARGLRRATVMAMIQAT